MRVLEDNAELKEKLSHKAMPKKEYFEFETPDGESKPLLQTHCANQLPVFFELTTCVL